MSKTVLVTEAAGFIGSHFCRSPLEHDFDFVPKATLEEDLHAFAR